MLFGMLKDDVMVYFKGRGRYAMVLLVLLCAVLFSRLAYLQVFQFDELTRLSENNRIRVMPVKADRGFIKDRNGILLVRNAPAYEIEITKEDVKDMNGLLDNLTQVISFDKERVLRRIKQSRLYEPVRAARGLTFEQFSYLMQHSGEYSGVQLNVDPIRSYIDGDILSHILGYLAEVAPEDVGGAAGYSSGDIVGKSGIEKSYDLVLRGAPGVQQVEVDNLGRVTEVLSQEAAIPGKNLILTIDYRLQEYISQLLTKKKGAVVVLDSSDNSVLAMYSAPTYDIGLFAPFITDENWAKLRDDSATPLLNRAVEGTYAPGSVFKVLVALAGLQEGIITPETKFYCSGSYRVGSSSSVHNCWKRTGHGDIKLREALAESCDVYFYNLGTQLGIDKLHEYATHFGQGMLTGIALPNEKTGIFPSQEWKMRARGQPWYPGETVNVSIGQGQVTSTPLQIAVMYSSLFNGGIVYTPRIVEAYEDPVTGERERIPPHVRAEYPIDKKIADLLMEGLVKSLERTGTSWRGRVEGLVYGGKTGTAQIVSLRHFENMKEEDIPEHLRDNSWYAGIYSADNPRYVVVVMIENGGSGGRISAPVAAEIIKKMLELGYVSED